MGKDAQRCGYVGLIAFRVAEIHRSTRYRQGSMAAARRKSPLQIGGPLQNILANHAGPYAGEAK